MRNMDICLGTGTTWLFSLLSVTISFHFLGSYTCRTMPPVDWLLAGLIIKIALCNSTELQATMKDLLEIYSFFAVPFINVQFLTCHLLSAFLCFPRHLEDLYSAKWSKALSWIPYHPCLGNILLIFPHFNFSLNKLDRFNTSSLQRIYWEE